MHPAVHAELSPDRPAVVTDRGAVLTYAELDRRSNQLAHLLREQGLRPGDHLALIMGNDPELFEICWAALRSGLIFTPLNWHLSEAEMAYIVDDADAVVLIAGIDHRDAAEALGRRCPGLRLVLAVGPPSELIRGYEPSIAPQPTGPIADECEGADMLYTSGTTGQPKGVLLRPPVERRMTDPHPHAMLLAMLYGFGADSVYLCTAPLYHAAPLAYSLNVQRLGGTVVTMSSFDAERSLELIAEHQVTHSQWVPTMFIRLLRLPDEARRRHDLSSQRVALHAGAPCPVPVKRQMIDWWGPILWEYYGGTERNGLTVINSDEWLVHPGSVGRGIGCQLHVVGTDGTEVRPDETGTVYFESALPFEYHKDPAKTAAARHPAGWTTLGDIGHVDADGYLHLTDRAAHTIVSAGVNIYPQEAENVLATHPDVSDVAVIGVPNEEYGEEVKAVVVLVDPASASPELAAALVEHCRATLSRFKCPRSVDFADALPRDPNGKLYKRTLRDAYWQGHSSRVV